MKKSLASNQGVTLLEIMLVLAVAAMIIVMSVRYYQSATASAQVNSLMEQIQAITASADGVAQGANSYIKVTTAAVTPMMPNQSMKTVWGTAITISTPSASTYTVTIPGVPQNVCSQVVSNLGANSKYTNITPTDAAACAAGANTISYIYNSQS